MIEIPLTRGLVAKIDDADAAAVQPYKWYAQGGRNNRNVYARGWVCDRPVMMHRFLLGLCDDHSVDHIDGDTLNNSRANLRLASIKENRWNSGKKSAAQSKYKGISKYPRCASWVARIQADGVHYYLGSFKCEEEAARAYDTAAKQFFGPFARLNFPEDKNIVPPETKIFQEGATECGLSQTAHGQRRTA